MNLEYRLAEENPFPAAVIDTLSAYAWLLEVVGLKPEQVIIEGDSGGGTSLTEALRCVRLKLTSRAPLTGNIALSAIHHLRTTKMLPLPGGLLLVSVSMACFRSRPHGNTDDSLSTACCRSDQFSSRPARRAWRHHHARSAKLGHRCVPGLRTASCRAARVRIHQSWLKEEPRQAASK